MIQDLPALRDYVKGLGWIMNGSIVHDLNNVIEYILHEGDSSYLTANWRRARSILHFWCAWCREQMSLLDIELCRSRGTVDPEARRSLISHGMTVNQDTIRAQVLSNEEIYTLTCNQVTMQRLLGTLSGMLDSLDPSVIVQESVNLRKQEEIDSNSGSN